MNVEDYYDFLVIPGMEYEVTRLREVDPDDEEDVYRMKRIDRSPEVRLFMAESIMSHDDVIDFIEGSDEEVIFGIAGWSNVDEDERGELQGWVYVYAEDDVNERVVRAMGDRALEYRNIVEISYAKFPGAAKGQIASGVRQVCKLIEIEENLGFIHRYPDPYFIPQSRYVNLSRAKEKTLVVSFATDENPGSVRVLEKSGFVRVLHNIPWDPKHPRDLVDLYILDWQRLNRIIEEKRSFATLPQLF